MAIHEFNADEFVGNKIRTVVSQPVLCDLLAQVFVQKFRSTLRSLGDNTVGVMLLTLKNCKLILYWEDIYVNIMMTKRAFSLKISLDISGDFW